MWRFYVFFVFFAQVSYRSTYEGKCERAPTLVVSLVVAISNLVNVKFGHEIGYLLCLVASSNPKTLGFSKW
jgi:hypothetical protein